MKDGIRLDLGFNVASSLCRWARNIIVKHFQQDLKIEFTRFNNYIEELKRSKSNSVDLEAPGRVFSKIYMCFNAIRVGFKIGYKPIIGLDGYFLKNPF